MMKTVEDLLINNVAKRPFKTAFKQPDYEVSYYDVDNFSENLKNYLLTIGVIPSCPVIILADRSIDIIISMYAVLKTGAFFVPLNPNENIERLQKIVKDCTANFIITTEKYINSAMQLIGNTTIVIVVSNDSNMVGNDQESYVCHFNYTHSINNADFYQKVHNEESIAYMIYTSGSSGKPKGVMIKHKGFINFIHETVRIFSFNEETKILTTKPFYFDAVMTDLFCVTYAGGTTVVSDENFIMPRNLIRRIIEERVSHLSVAPGIVKLLVESEVFTKNDFSFIRTFSFGADIVPSYAIAQLKKDLPHVRFFNRYGLTETTVVCSAYEVQSITPNEKIPIGKPLRNMSFYVLSEDMKMVKPGEIGELFICGCQVMAGYWNDELLTSEVLKHDIIDEKVLFKSGDLVYENLNGDFVFVGRKDSTFNKNGFRINLIEIEDIIRKTDGITDCVCLVEKLENNAIVTAFIKSKKSVDVIKSVLKCHLPKHMIPENIVLVKDIPLSGAGKPDNNILKSWACQAKSTFK